MSALIHIKIKTNFAQTHSFFTLNDNQYMNILIERCLEILTYIIIIIIIIIILLHGGPESPSGYIYYFTLTILQRCYPILNPRHLANFKAKQKFIIIDYLYTA